MALVFPTSYKCDNPFNCRWTDVVLRKVLHTKLFFETESFNSNGRLSRQYIQNKEADAWFRSESGFFKTGPDRSCYRVNEGQS